jgi:Protein of unknown function (DUF2752)
MQGSIWPSAREWWQSLRWVYLTFTLLILIALAGSFIPYESVVADGHPWLPRNECPGCPLCGMTRSFCALSAGRFSEAVAWNRGGPVLYVCGWLWLFGSAAARIRMMRREVKPAG